MSRARLVSILALLCALAAAWLPALPGASAAGSLRVEIIDQAPAVLAGPSDITLRVRVTNESSTPIPEPVAEVRLQTWTPVARERLDDWLSGRDDNSSTPLTTTTLKELGAGASAEASLTVPKEDLPTISRGPRGILVRVAAAGLRDGAGDAGSAAPPEAGIARSYVVNWPDTSLPASNFLILGTASAPSRDILADPMSDAATPERKAAIATLASAGVTLAGDPALRGLEATPMLTLPAGDPDISALASFDAGRARLAESLRAAPSSLPLLWWPREVSKEALALRPKDAVLVVRDDQVRKPAATYYTPSGIATVSGAPALVIDTKMSAHLAARDEPIAHRQALLAHAAATIRERPNDPRTFVLALPRDVDAEAAAAAVAALTGAPFTMPGTVPPVTDGAFVQTDGQRPATWAVAEQSAAAPETAINQRASEAIARASAIASTTSNGDSLVSDLRIAERHLWSTALAESRGERMRVLDAIEQRAASLAGAITVETASSLLLISDQPDIPIHINSALSAPADVVVDLVAQDPRLQTPGAVEATLTPGARTTVAMPVNAVGSGDLKVRVRVMSADGQEIASSAPFDVRVRADWENVGTAIAAAALALLVVGGIIRTIARNRQRGVRGRGHVPPAATAPSLKEK